MIMAVVLVTTIFTYSNSCKLDKDIICMNGIQHIYSQSGELITVKRADIDICSTYIPCKCPEKKEKTKANSK